MNYPYFPIETLNAMAKHSPEMFAQVAEYLDAGQKLRAVKHMKVILPIGLKEAKDFVDQWDFPRKVTKMAYYSTELPDVEFVVLKQRYHGEWLCYCGNDLDTIVNHVK